MPQKSAALDELQQFIDASAKAFEQAVEDHVRAILGRGNQGETLAALHRTMALSMALADLHGRRRLVLEARALRDRQPVDAPAVTFDEGDSLLGKLAVRTLPEFNQAAEALAARTPELAEDFIFGPGDGGPLSAKRQPLWKTVGELYQKSDRVFSMAQRGDRVIHGRILSALDRIQQTGEALTRVIEGRGKTVDVFERAMEEMFGFNRAYAETVYRTNLNTAYTDGRFEQARDPDVAEVIGALEYMSVNDSAVRPTHEAMDGFLAAVTHPIWRNVRPPNGYNCRCTVRLVDKFELRDRGLLTPEGHVKPVNLAAARAFKPDEGFDKPEGGSAVYG